MKFDSFLTSPRWEILKILAKSPSSPIELAEILGTTVAYMSQQLKLLDAANLVVKTKTGASEKGKPRSIYRLVNEKIYFASLFEDLSIKKVINAEDYHKAVMKIWSIENSSLHFYFEKLYFKLEENKKDIERIYLDLSYPKFVVVSSSSKLKSLILSFIGRFPKKVDCDFVNESQMKNVPAEGLVVIYGPSLEDKKLKGGKEI